MSGGGRVLPGQMIPEVGKVMCSQRQEGTDGVCDTSTAGVTNMPFSSHSCA